MSTQKANHDTEVLDADLIEGDEDETEATDDDEEMIIPEDPLGEGDDGKKKKPTIKKEEDDEESESEDDEDVELETEEDEDVEEDDLEKKPDESSLENELKPVPGETPREKALRAALLQARRDNKVLRTKKLMESDETVEHEGAISEEDYKALREDYDDDEIQRMEKFIDIVARKKGYVKSDTLVANEGNKALDQFITEHPQYDPENDPGDKNWKTFTKILERDYNYRGKKPEDLKVIFAKVHRDVNKELGIKSSASTDVELEKRKIDAKRQKVRAAGFSNGSGGSKTPVKTTETVKKPAAAIDPKVRAMFKGFDDEDFE